MFMLPLTMGQQSSWQPCSPPDIHFLPVLRCQIQAPCGKRRCGRRCPSCSGMHADCWCSSVIMPGRHPGLLYSDPGSRGRGSAPPHSDAGCHRAECARRWRRWASLMWFAACCHRTCRNAACRYLTHSRNLLQPLLLLGGQGGQDTQSFRDCQGGNCVTCLFKMPPLLCQAQMGADMQCILLHSFRLHVCVW